MAEQDPNLTPEPGGEPEPSLAPPTPVTDRLTPELEQELNYYRQQFQDPLLNRVLQNPQERQLAERALRYYDTEQAQLDDTPPALKETRDEVRKLNERFEKAEKESSRVTAANMMQELAKTHSFLSDDNWKNLTELEREAEQIGIKADDYLGKARYVSNIIRRLPSQKKTAPPPESLRADQGQPGVPGAPTSKPKNPQQIREWLIAQARAANE